MTAAAVEVLEALSTPRFSEFSTGGPSAAGAGRIRSAVRSLLASRAVRTPDTGGAMNTSEMIRAIIQAVSAA